MMARVFVALCVGRGRGLGGQLKSWDLNGNREDSVW